MSARVPLYARVLGWFLLNVVVLGAALFFAVRSGRTSEWFVMQQAEPRLQSVARLLVQELHPLPEAEWDGILQKYSEAHSMTFTVFGGGGQQIAGESLTPPEKVRRHLNARPFQPGSGHQPGVPPLPPRDPQPSRFEPGDRPFQAPPYGAQNPPPGEPRFPGPPQPNPPRGLPRPDAPFAKIFERTDNPEACWFIIRVPLRAQGGPGGMSMVLRTENLSAGGLLMDFTPWLWGAAGMLVVSALLWIPFVRSITRQIAGMKMAAARIAEGKFDVVVPDGRRDELGELAGGINRMAARLSGFVSGQKRFLGDIAHELCTPLARMQMAGAALEQRAPEDLHSRVTDLTIEVEAMSQIVGELLDFSRAGLAPASVALTDSLLLPLIQQVTAREAVAANRLTLHVPPDLIAHTNPGLFCRAVGNVVRNALRYAGPQAHLEVSARKEGTIVVLTIADNGPGVPEDALASLFDPFYRLETARDRESGGTGLGLAIVRTCIESCGGTVTARNREVGGLEVAFRLPAAC